MPRASQLKALEEWEKENGEVGVVITAFVSERDWHQFRWMCNRKNLDHFYVLNLLIKAAKDDEWLKKFLNRPKKTQEETAEEAESRFLAAVNRLALDVEEEYPIWAYALQIKPAVYVPHTPYPKYTGVSTLGCCDFQKDHPIHNMPEWQFEHVGS